MVITHAHETAGMPLQAAIWVCLAAVQNHMALFAVASLKRYPRRVRRLQLLFGQDEHYHQFHKHGNSQSWDQGAFAFRSDLHACSQRCSFTGYLLHF